MVTDEPNYSVEFEIADDGQAVTLVRDTLRAAGVGSSAEISFGRGRRYSVYDDSLTDLGPCPPLPQPQVASPVESAAPPNRYPQDFLAHLTQLTEDARKEIWWTQRPKPWSLTLRRSEWLAQYGYAGSEVTRGPAIARLHVKPHEQMVRPSPDISPGCSSRGCSLTL